MSVRECGFCGRHRLVKDRVDGRARCATCRNRDPDTWIECGSCHRARPVNARAADGTARCGTCYAREHAPTVSCQRCGTLGPVAVRAGGRTGATQTLCMSCHPHPARRCGGCGRTRRVAVKATAASTDLCPTCYQAPTLTCSRCGITDLCRRTGPAGAPLCFRCQLTEKLDRLLTPPGHSRPPTRLHPFRDAVLAVHNPRTALHWLRSPAAALLTRISAGELPLTHASLDTANLGVPTHANSVEHLRRLLVASGALPERDEHLARLRLHATELSDTLTHHADQHLFRSYALWHVLRRAGTTPLSPSAAHRARSQLTAATRLLTALRHAGTDLAHAQQSDLDDWLATAPPHPHGARSFLTWAANRRSTTIALPPAARTELPRDFTDDQHRWRLANRLLHDDTIAVADRVAGLLVLLYGQRAPKITQLTVDDVRTSGTEIRLALGHDELLLPEPLARLITRLPDKPPAGIATHLATPRWLFPGRLPDRPLHPCSLMRRLAAHDIPLRLIRNAALLDLARELPALVLADLLGLHINTATRWTDAAAGRWSTYAAHRSTTTP